MGYSVCLHRRFCPFQKLLQTLRHFEFTFHNNLLVLLKQRFAAPGNGFWTAMWTVFDWADVNTHRTIWDCFSNTDKHAEFHFSLQTTSIYRSFLIWQSWSCFFAILLATDWSAHPLSIFLTFTRKRRRRRAVVSLCQVGSAVAVSDAGVGLRTRVFRMCRRQSCQRFSALLMQ